MSRVLIVVPPLAGHVNPTVSLGAELAARGHTVAWAGLPGVVDALLPPGSGFLPVVGTLDESGFAQLRRRGHGLRGPEALRFLWQEFLIPYAMGTTPELIDQARGFAPDIMLVDQQAVAGAVVARRLGIPWATSAATPAELGDPLRAMPKVDAWVRAQLLDLHAALGATAAGDVRFSERLVIAFTTPELLGPVACPRPATRFVGPAISARPDPTPFPWGWLDPRRRHVLVTLGTVNAGAGKRFFAAALEALAAAPLQAVFVMPAGLAELPAHATNVLVRERVPQLRLLEQMDAVVSHAGNNTVCESLAHGLPLVLAPIRDDQPLVAEQVVRAGAGVRVRFGRVTAAELRVAVMLVLEDASYARGAAVIQRSFRDAGGARAAADAVEELLLAD